MSWITLTPDDLNEYLAATQLKALRTKALADGQSDPLPAIIAEVARTVRTAIASAGLPVEMTAGTFPEALRPAVAALTIELAQTRLPGLALTAEQKKQADAARSAINQILSRRIGVEMPQNPDYSMSGVGTSAVIRAVSAREGKVTGADLSKLS